MLSNDKTSFTCSVSQHSVNMVLSFHTLVHVTPPVVYPGNAAAGQILIH